MSRPFKCRRIGFCPEITYFKPAGIPLRQLEEVVLTFDELEALRLADMEGLYQEAAALKMEVSRQTFGNIINSAHRKIADALVNAKAIKIEQRTYTMEGKRKFICSACDHKWEEIYGTGRPRYCPKCQSNQLEHSSIDRRFAGVGGCGGKQNGRENEV